jgi:hypothetical protein
MGQKMGIAMAAFAFATAGASAALAQNQMVDEQSSQSAQVAQSSQYSTTDSERLPRGTVKAPANAFEIQVNTGYAQGFGPQIPARGSLPGTSLDRAGMGAGLGLAYRGTPNASVGILGSYSMQDSANGAQLRSAVASLDATYHANPYQRLDPFLSLGAGYRMVWDRPTGGSPDTFTHGFQLGRAAVGVDVRVSKDIAIAPTVGGDVNMFLWRSGQGQSTQTIQNPKVNAFLFAGVTGRFDLGGTRQGPPTLVGRR